MLLESIRKLVGFTTREPSRRRNRAMQPEPLEPRPLLTTFTP
jgi:hypothetical protein